MQLLNLYFELMLYQITRRVSAANQEVNSEAKPLGLHAFGNVGKYVADIARGFGMDIYAYDPFVSERVMKNNGAKQCINIEELYSKCQYISIHMPSNNITNKSIGYDLMKKMPSNAVLVNTAQKRSN